MSKNLISPRTVRAFERFNADLRAFGDETEETYVTLYEDAYTTRKVANFRLCLNGKLKWIEISRGELSREEVEQLTCDDEAREYLSFWRSCLRRARRYWSMSAEDLDRIQDPESGVEDQDDDE